MIVTIRDVAERAGVSPKTVSRVMNDEAHVRPGVRERVLSIVAQMGYRPNAYARSLSSSRSYLLALLFDDPASGYATAIQNGASEKCREKNYHLVVEKIDLEIPAWKESLTRSIGTLRFDGVILPPPLCEHIETIDLLEEHGIPYVRISPGATVSHRSGSVGINEQKASHEMTRFLIDLGHRDIAFIEGSEMHPSAHARRTGFTKAMAAAGINVPSGRIQAGDFSFRSGLEAAERLLSFEQKPTAIFAANDDMALGAFVAAMKAGMAVPHTISFAGFDDAPAARMAWPALTTIRQPVQELGAEAVEILIQPAYKTSVEAPEFRRELPYMLVERGSTSKPAKPKRI